MLVSVLHRYVAGTFDLSCLNFVVHFRVTSEAGGGRGKMDAGKVLHITSGVPREWKKKHIF